MRRTNIILLLPVLILLASSCIKQYVPEINTKDLQKYVVSGQVTTAGSQQTVNVSRTSPVGDPKYIPVSNCQVKIIDDRGNEFPASYVSNGDYTTTISPEFLVAGVSFKVTVITPDGTEISSEFDQLNTCPEVDSVYYVRKDVVASNSTEFIKGIQIYIDLNTKGTSSRYYRWEAIETWEYHADYPLTGYYDGVIHRIDADFSRFTCWSTLAVPDIFTLSTTDVQGDKYLRFPLQFVGNHTSRLMYGYSLLIRQYALSEAAYNYWDELRINNKQQGGLYTKQPLAIKGNMHNVTDPKEEVLGFFTVADVRTKRIFIRPIPDLPMDFGTSCIIDTVPARSGFSAYKPSTYPLYLLITSNLPMMILSEVCVNCLKLGGTNVKPDFWPNE
jgi:hypothetical protein